MTKSNITEPLANMLEDRR